jgi:signal transduction histidine kinase
MSRVAERLREFGPQRWDALLAAVLTLAMISSVLSVDRTGPLAANFLVALPITAALAWRRSHPLAMNAVVCALLVAGASLLTSPTNYPPAVFALIIAAYSVGTYATGRSSLLGLGLTSVAILTVAFLDTPGDVFFPLFVFGVAPWMAGRVLAGQTALARELAEKEARLQYLRDQRAASAVAAERARVAREVHDVLAHNLSVMVVQASGARHTLASNPQAASRAAELIEHTGREALAELRHVFGPVRRGEVESLDGLPGLGQVEALVDRARRAGLPVKLDVEGDRVDLGPGADIAAYRLVQEGLTNAYKHAGAADTEVRIRYRPDGVAIEIVDAGNGPAPADADVEGGGHGLVGMRERMRLFGGELEAGPVPGGGFRVSARLPREAQGVPA